MRESANLLRILVVALLPLTASGCVRGCTSSRPPIHLNPNMDNQPKYLPQAESRFFYDGAAMQRPVEGTIARGDLWENEEHVTGRSLWGFYIPENPLPVTDPLVARGRDRYGIYCTPCHGERGDGRGMLFQRSGVKAANLLEDRIRQMPDGQIYYIVTNGSGLMSGYRYPIQPKDRWAIVAYVRRLQSSR